MGMAALGCASKEYVDQLDLSSPLPFELTAAALGLLLVFRTNSSYSRWVRAQDSIAMVGARSRELVYLSYNIQDDHLRSQMVRYIVAHALVLKTALLRKSGLSPPEAELEDRMRADELELLRAQQNQPSHTLQVMTALLWQAGLTPAVHGRFLECLGSFASSAQALDLLYKAPIPLSYTRHTSRFLMLWTTFVALPLAHQMELMAIPAIFFISIVLLGVEEIGVQLEEPVSLLDLEGMVEDIVGDVDEASAARQAIQTVAAFKAPAPVDSNVSTTSYI